VGIRPQEGENKVAILIQFALSINQSCVFSGTPRAAYSVTLRRIRPEFGRGYAHMNVHQTSVKSLGGLCVGCIAAKNHGYLKAVRCDIALELRF
jgi:hypothetical protein